MAAHQGNSHEFPAPANRIIPVDGQFRRVPESFITSAMPCPICDDDIEFIPLQLPLDNDTREWLTALARGSDAEAARIIASMLRDIRLDDERAHATTH